MPTTPARKSVLSFASDSFTLGDLRSFVARAADAGWPDGATIQAKVSLRGKLREIVAQTDESEVRK